MHPETIELYRPVGPEELDLIAASGYREYPPRLTGQPIFYPVLDEEYARQIARDWNVPASGAGYVTQFALQKELAAGYPVRQVGASTHRELWIPAEDLAEMNRNIVGRIEVIAEYRERQEMKLRTEPYLKQLERWPASGRHILAQFDAETMVVYQAYRPTIGLFAARHQRFGGDFSLKRMSWIKPNFLWMMYRSGWGMKEGQEVTLAVRLRRTAFDEILQQAVHSTYVPAVYGSPENWKARLAQSPVRLQWDPDHDPRGDKLERRAIQLGLAEDVLLKYAREWIVSIEDVSGFVAEQRTHADANGFGELLTPHEEVYPINNADVARHLGIDRPSGPKA